MAIAHPAAAPSVLLYDDQLSPGKARAAILRQCLDVDVLFQSRVDDVVEHFLTDPFDLIILDYFDQSEFGSDRSCLEILERGRTATSRNARTAVIVHSVLNVPEPEAKVLRERWNVTAIESRLLGNDNLVTVAAGLLGRSAPPPTPSTVATGIGKLVHWSPKSKRGLFVLPALPDYGELLVDGRDLEPQLVRLFDKRVDAGEPLSEDEPLLLRVEWNRDATSTYDVDMKVLELLGPADLFRANLRVGTPAIADPETPRTTPAGRRAEARGPADGEGAELAAQFGELTGEDSTGS